VHDDDNYEWKPIYERKDNPSTLQAQQWQGWGTALKPAFEPVIVARKPIEGTVANNVLKWGTGGLNIDGSRIGTSKPEAKNTPFNSWREAEGRDDRQNPTQTYDATQGRWPANIILDPYTAELLDEQSGTLKSGQLKPGRNHAGNNVDFLKGINEHTWSGDASSGGASRFFYVAKASKRDRNEGLEELEKQLIEVGDERPSGNSWERRDDRHTKPRQNFHPTVKPTTLMEYLIKLVTPPNGTVLDPFTGSGSTGKAAILQGFHFIGIEMTEEYLPIIEGRLKHAEAKVAERIKETADQEQEKLF
jgi:site-specific DNA-methyltransferase (adenine-specific)